MRRTLAILLVILLVMMVSTSAAAECAWVLWGWRDGPQPGGGYVNSQYHPLESFQSSKERLGLPAKVACEDARERYRQGNGWPRFVCLTDTVDPRAPKGA